MICQIHGTLLAVEEAAAQLQVGEAFAYEVLVSSYTAARLGGLIGQPLTLHTLHYLESQGQGSSFLPRLAGFLTAADRDFFELFTTTKGIGNRKALRALALATDQIAAAIADRDLAMLQGLPEIGRRTAETIIATLHGKVDRFVSAASFSVPRPAAGGAGAAPTIARDALEVLLQLGENRTQAVSWIDQVLRDEPTEGRPRTAEELIERVYRLKAR